MMLPLLLTALLGRAAGQFASGISNGIVDSPDINCQPHGVQMDFRTKFASGISNGIVDSPDINCQPHGVQMDFRTKAPFKGHVFVRGHYNEEDCHKDYVLNDVRAGAINLQFDKCGMRRKRSASPRGMGMSATVVVSFHRTFITALDRAYRVECFYMEADKVLTQSIGVSMITPSVLNNDPQPMPDCQYKVLRDGPDGPALSFAKVGDRVYHHWSCVYPLQNMYCMMIHSCTVDNGEASIYEVIDPDGCPRDPTILGGLQYQSDLEAGTNAFVFKFADKPRVYFTCQVRLSLRVEDNGGVCPRPSCEARRRRRDIVRGRHLPGTDFDLQAEPLLIVEEDEGPVSGALAGPPPRDLPSWDPRPPAGLGGGTLVCLSQGSVAGVLAVVLLIALASAFVAVLFCCKYKAWKP